MMSMMRRFGCGLGLGLLVLAATGQVQARVESSAAEIRLPSGVGVVAPSAWSVRREASSIILETPEPGSFLIFTDTSGGDGDHAVAAAWAAHDKTALPQLSVRDLPLRDGWAQIRSYAYRAEEGRTAYARAYREGGDWTVVLYDMDDAVAEKRDSQIEVALGRLFIRGYRRESFAGRQAHRLDATRVQALTDLIETARADLDIPGVALGLVQDGEVVFQGGFGVREIGRSETVDADTAFMIGSNGKALTTLLLARLVERGLLDWDTPVSSVWPAFRLGDAVTTRQVRVRHLVCACTGLPRQDYPWIFQGDEAQAATVLDWLSAMKPTSDFGELYQYSNLMAAAGGYLAAHILHPEMELGAAYDLAMQDEVFGPLGMTETTFNQAHVMAGDHASPHALDIDGVQRVAVMGLNDAGVPYRPDGGEWSTVRDMLRYVQMELARGRLPDGRRYIAEEPLLARRIPQVAEGSDEYYGMGLMIDEIWGVPIVHHGGTQYGYRADMIWLPDQNVGAVILINSDSGAALRSVFRRRLLEVLFDGEPRAAADLENYARRFKASLGEGRRSMTATADSQAASRLADRYVSKDLGPLTVHRQDASTVFDFGGWRSEMASQTDDNGATSFVSITPGADGYVFEERAGPNGRQLVTREGSFAYVFDELK